jgi:hypothetical protein
VCTYASQPEFKWFSTTDRSTPALGLTCVRLAERPVDVGPTSWWRFWKLLQLIEGVP